MTLITLKRIALIALAAFIHRVVESSSGWERTPVRLSNSQHDVSLQPDGKSVRETRINDSLKAIEYMR